MRHTITALPPTIYDASFFRYVSRVTSVSAVVIGVVGLAGWIFGVPTLKSILPGLATMKANTAICFILAGLSLWFALIDVNPQHTSRIAAMFALAVMIIGGLVLSQYAFGWQLGIDELIFRDPDTAPAAFPGRMSPGTAINFLLLGTALLGLQFSRLHIFSQLLAVVASIISLIALMGYIYGTDSLYRILFFSSMALHTAIMFGLFSIGVFFAKPTEGFTALFTDRGPGGTLARSLIPTSIIGPMLIGWFILRGEAAGLYDEIILTDLLVLMIILLLVVVIIMTAVGIHRTDIARRHAEQQLVKLNRVYHTLSDSNQALVRATDEHKLLEDVCLIITSVGDYALAWVMLKGETKIAAYSARTTQVSEPNPTYVEPMTQQAISIGEPQTLVNIPTLPNVSPAWISEAHAFGYTSLIVLPVRDNGTIFGALHIYSADEDGFSEPEIRLFRELAGDLAFGMITLRTRLAHYNAEENVRYQAELLQNVSDAVVATDLNFKVLSWNKAAERLYGWQADEVMGATVSLFLKSRPAENNQTNFSTLFDRGFWQGEVIQDTKERGSIYMLSSVSFITNTAGQRTGIVAVNRDLTELRTVSNAIVAYEEKFRTIFEEALDVVMILDSETGRIVNVNRVTNSILLYESSDLIDQHFSMLFAKSVVQSRDDFIAQIHAYGAVFVGQEFVRANGTICSMDLTAAIIPWEDGRAILVTLRDVTERKRMEEALFQAELMRVTLEKEREIIKLKEDFIATVSHDFRTPLTVIFTTSEMLLRYGERLTPASQIERLTTIGNQARYMTNLLDDVLLFSKVRAGRLRVEPSFLSLETYCGDLFEQLQLQSKGAHSFIFEVSGELDNALLDEKILQRILVNLISNAIKYSPEGGEVRFTVKRDVDEVVFTISDQGVGIPLTDQVRIFEPFQRSNNVRNIEGTGLGMAIVYENINLHGGSITLDSEEGKGTTFIVRLPYQFTSLPDTSSFVS